MQTNKQTNANRTKGFFYIRKKIHTFVGISMTSWCMYKGSHIYALQKKKDVQYL